ncbi:hypothetical protein REH65_31105 [Saccharopolyspora sp. ID03-671]|uniref:hypothetical protein n=1 Tax=Saccharopolyspora sp. ID03-671 TaxID=3073066 RepID=UPI0032546828
MSTSRKADLRSAGAVLGLMTLAVLCCAGPALIAAGALGALGAWLANPWVLAAAVLLLVGLGAWALRRNRGTTRADCCPPASPANHHTRTDDQER